MAVSKKIQPWCWIPTVVVLVGIASGVLLLWGNRIGERQLKNHIIMDVTMDVQLNASTAHLWLEEAVGGDDTADEALADMDQAIDLIDLFIKGGEYEFGRVLEPLNDAVLRAHAEEIKSLLVKLKRRAQERLRDIEKAGIASVSDQQFDAVFKAILRKSRTLEELIERKNVESRAKSGRLLLGILFAWTVIALAATTGLWNLEVRRKNAEEALRKTNEQLLSAHEELVHKEKLAMLGLIAGGMGNELLNPLGVMNNAVFFLKCVMSEADETVREYLDIIQEEIDNSEGIISGLLDFYRIKPPQARVLLVRELIDQSLKRCAIPDNIRVRVEVPEELPAMRTDAMQMGQVLRNLITNAIQAMPEGGALRIGARLNPATCNPPTPSGVHAVGRGRSRLLREPPAPAGGGSTSALEADFVEISLTDTGVGISPANREKLFQPLFTTKSRGIGLGLALSKKLTEANGGTVSVDSEIGKGATFTVTLPAKGA